MRISLRKITEEPPSSFKSSSSHSHAPKKSLCSPLQWLFHFGGLFGRHAQRKDHSLQTDMAELLEEHDPEGTRFGSEERLMLSNVLGLKDLRIEDIMIPRSTIIAVEKDVTLEGLKKVLLKEEHTRMPVYDGNLDNIIGFVHIKDLIPLLGSRKKFDISSLVREILFVPPSMKVRDLLLQMRAKRIHIALVVDEYGATDGLITLEDLVEEIVGEIEDEHDDADPVFIRELEPGRYEMDARTPVEEAEKQLGISLRSSQDHETCDTLGGMVFLMLDRVPEKGESVVHPAGFTFEILDADPRRIKQILVTRS